MKNTKKNGKAERTIKKINKATADKSKHLQTTPENCQKVMDAIRASGRAPNQFSSTGLAAMIMRLREIW